MSDFLAAALIIASVVVVGWAYLEIRFSGYLFRRNREQIQKNYARCRSERDYQNVWFNRYGGEIEVSVGERRAKGRIDWIGTVNGQEYAAEVDFAAKWADAIGQAMFYSASTGKRGLIILIIKSADDKRHLKKIQTALSHYSAPIDVVTLPDEDFYSADNDGQPTKISA